MGRPGMSTSPLGSRSARPSQTPTDERDGAESPERSVTGAAFWALMDRWRVPDEPALRLISGPPSKRPGARPRFRLRGVQLETYDLLRAIDRHLEDLFGLSRDWLARPVRQKPFAGRAPLVFMAEGGAAAVADTLRHLEREAFRASLARSAKA